MSAGAMNRAGCRWLVSGGLEASEALARSLLRARGPREPEAIEAIARKFIRA